MFEEGGRERGRRIRLTFVNCCVNIMCIFISPRLTSLYLISDGWEGRSRKRRRTFFADKVFSGLLFNITRLVRLRVDVCLCG